jgi:hypothetical protein
MKSPGICVWAAVSSKGLIGPYFFQAGADNANHIFPDTVNGDRYLKMLKEFFLPKFLQMQNNERLIFSAGRSTSAL